MPCAYIATGGGGGGGSFLALAIHKPTHQPHEHCPLPPPPPLRRCGCASGEGEQGLPTANPQSPGCAWGGGGGAGGGYWAPLPEPGYRGGHTQGQHQHWGIFVPKAPAWPSAGQSVPRHVRYGAHDSHPPLIARPAGLVGLQMGDGVGGKPPAPPPPPV